MPRFDEIAFERRLLRLSPEDRARAIAIAERVRDSSEATIAFDSRTADGGPLANCPHCGSGKRRRWGKTRTGVRRYRCGKCGSTWSGRTGTPIERVKFPDRMLKPARNMVEATQPWSCREAARELGVAEETVWQWRIRIISALQPEREAALTGTVEADEARQRESRKASREWVRHAADPENNDKPPRKRWRDLLPGEKPPGGWSHWQRKFLAATNRGGSRSFEAIADAGMKEISVPLLRALSPDAVLCTDGWPPYARIAKDANIAHFALVKGRRVEGMPKSAHINTVNSRIDRFRTFMKPFRGSASKYRAAYGRWFAARDNRDRDYLGVFNMFLAGV